MRRSANRRTLPGRNHAEIDEGLMFSKAPTFAGIPKATESTRQSNV